MLKRFSIRERKTHAYLGHVYAANLPTARRLALRDQREEVFCKRSRHGITVHEDRPVRKSDCEDQYDLPVWY